MDANEYKYEMNVGQEITADDLGATYFNVYERKCPPELPSGFWDKKPRVFGIKRVTEEYYILRIANITLAWGFLILIKSIFATILCLPRLNTIIVSPKPTQSRHSDFRS